MIALTSDFICYLLVPSKWLFLVGSTCVWMEMVWHAGESLSFVSSMFALCFLLVLLAFISLLADVSSYKMAFLSAAWVLFLFIKSHYLCRCSHQARMCFKVIVGFLGNGVFPGSNNNKSSLATRTKIYVVDIRWNR